MRTVFVSVKKSYQPGMTADDLAEAAHAAWPLSMAKVEGAKHLVAVIGDTPLMAWPILGTYVSEVIYKTTGGERRRVAFSLGASVPIQPKWHDVPVMRRGCFVRRGET